MTTAMTLITVSEDGTELFFKFEGTRAQLALCGATTWSDDWKKTTRYREAVHTRFTEIVRAVNTHETLVVAWKEAERLLASYIEYNPHSPYRDIPSPCYVRGSQEGLTEIRAALTKAEGTWEER